MTDDFNPATVPPFPVVTLELHDDDSVSVDGHPVDIGMDQAPTDAGIQAVAQRAAAAGLQAVRVRATSPDGTHFMVVTDQGAAYPIGGTGPTDGRSNANRPRRALAVGLAVVALLVVGGAVGVATFAIASTQATPAPSPSWTPPGAGSNLPIPAPPGFGQEATWAVEVSKSTAPVMVDTSRIALVTAEGTLSVLDAETGKPVWTGSGRVDGQGGIHVSAVQGTPVLATASSTSLSLWPLDSTGTAAVTPTTLKTGARATVTYLGSAPLVDLGSQTIAIVVNAALQRVDVPVTSSAVMATATGAIAANGSQWWALGPDTSPTAHQMPQPADAVGEPTLISATDDDHLVVLWPTDTTSNSVAALVRLSDNSIVATATVPSRAISSRDTPIRSAAGQTAVLGSLFIDYSNTPQMVTIANVQPSAVNGTTVYGTLSGAPVTAVLNGGTFTVTPFTTVKTAEAAPPAAVTDSQAFMIARKVDDTLLYALPHQG